MDEVKLQIHFIRYYIIYLLAACISLVISSWIVPLRYSFVSTPQWDLRYISAIFFFILSTLFLVPAIVAYKYNRDKKRPNRGIFLTCPQGTIIYRMTSGPFTNNSQETVDQTLKEALAANPNIDPRDYEQALKITIVRFDRTKDKSAPTEDVDAGDLN